ncbi:hypothetical protein SDRG_03887 [Saprolegnia diclina VS20]|uniref:Uncharacterized protein n=1 Tax=Saprolegnia diclina (strain VS20) TaxID=1156394 RepID=T0QLJ0_SAPDV|nr:hypothetical protein SDRG_03887 [Saprolegnia diclina VS20]EQC38929.1 hypothetical protein SDRG_03887 [Saprolegnia diclina VS20]|eukprot:XP_008607753.1 hypothetical protein SDRG_03887 [Saprolegnia diclina VS20]
MLREVLPVVAGVHVEVDGLDGLSKDEKRRVLNRVRQREYRRLDLEELQMLRRRVADLEQTWTALTVHGKRDRMCMLPWKDVALGLRDETRVVVGKNRQLRDQLEYYTTMARVLGSWVARLSPTLQASMPPTPANWHSVALPADAGARGLAMDWLMTRLYHNVDGTFQANAFPSNSVQDFSDINIYLDDGKFQFVVRSQRVVHASLAYVEGVYGAFCDDVTEIGVENSTGNWVRRINQEELEGQNLVYGHQTLIKGVEQHYLCRRYTEPGRFVLVGQNIVEDAQYPSSQRGMYEETGWRVIEAIGPDQTLVKDCITVTSLSAADGSGYLSLDEYGAFFGIEVSDDQEEYLTVTNFRRRLQRFFGYLDRDLREYLTPP